MRKSCLTRQGSPNCRGETTCLTSCLASRLSRDDSAIFRSGWLNSVSKRETLARPGSLRGELFRVPDTMKMGLRRTQCRRRHLNCFLRTAIFVPHVTFLAVSRETGEGKAVTNHDSMETLPKVVSWGTVLSDP